MRHLLIRSLPGQALFLHASPLQADLLFSQPVIDGGVTLASDFGRSQQDADWPYRLRCRASTGGVPTPTDKWL